ncbi:MAG: DUF2344 domain-containing protein, partial [Desulfobacteraceae bacterium]|nr:DUF2344 domain-containing protein [Desulfobacteraceae bacterium]
NTWHQAASSSQIDMDFYLRQREKDEILPWQHLESGVDSSFLLEELDKAFLSSYTADCRYHGCHKCGLCDFKIIRPVVHEKNKKNMDDTPSPAKESMATPLHSDGEDLHFKYRVSYSRCGKICYLGHLEILQVIFRTLRRAKITTNFSKGFNPSPKISFGPALPVGVESLAEYFIMDLPTPLK